MYFQGVFMYLVFCSKFYLSNSLDTWQNKLKSHKQKNLEQDAITHLVEMSDMDEFKKILNPMLIERVSDTPGNRVVQEHIKKLMADLNWDIYEDTFKEEAPMPHGVKTFTNIVATNNVDAPRKLTLACHFDSKYYKNIKFIGATDSAVPCAMMIDLARNLNNLLNNSPTKVGDISLQLIFFDGEEAFVHWTATDSIYGARHLAAKMETTKVDVDREVTVNYLQTLDVIILLDLIGASNPTFRNFFDNTSHLFRKFQYIERILGQKGYLQPVDQFINKNRNIYFSSSRYGGSIQDDHIPFIHRNVPILHLISSPFPSVWHTADDNESILDYTVIDNLNKILRVFVASYLHLL